VRHPGTLEVFDNPYIPGWKIVNATGATEIQSNEMCPVCSCRLEDLARYSDDTRSLRLGLCSSCMHVTYKDKPSASWLNKFYSETWEAGKKNTSLKPLTNKKSAITKKILSVGLSHEAVILEIGTGHGRVLAEVVREGYVNAFGIENSHYRAQEIARKRKINVYEGSFESPAIQLLLEQKKPLDMIYSAHVFEHILDPGSIVNRMNDLLRQGGIAVVSVPNFFKEPVANVLFFLPHLHSFTAKSLSTLFEKRGFVIHSLSEENHELIIVAEKTDFHSEHGKKPTSHTITRESVHAKIAEELKLGETVPNKKYHLLWSTKKANQTFLLRGMRYFLKKIMCVIERKIFLQGPLWRSITIMRNSGPINFPLNIYFKKRIYLFYK